MINDAMYAIMTFYFMVFPFITIIMWQETNTSFLKFYFTKSDSVNWLGFSMFLILCSGSFIWYLFYIILNLIFYVIILPFIWLFEFLFLNKDCSHLNKELEEKLKG